jgi:hypothetical protein
MNRSLIRCSLVALALLVGPLSGSAGATTQVVDNVAPDGCTADSTQAIDANGRPSIVLIYSIPCASAVTTAPTRVQHVASVGEVQVMVPYMVHEPPSGTATKAIAVILTGGDGCAGIYPDYSPYADNPCLADVSTKPYHNFLIRSAALFAQHGFKALTIDRPLNVNPPQAAYDDYRRSQLHALDIAGVVGQENAGNKTVFLVGTSRGALSTFAQNVMGTASMLSSPVTACETPGCSAEHLDLDGSAQPAEFQPAWFVTPVVTMPVPVPVQVLHHKDDPCLASPPSGAKALADNLISDGVETFHNHEVGAFFDADPNEPCQALSLHGFLGIENAVVQRIARRMTSILNDEKDAHPNNVRPVSSNASVVTNAAGLASIDLTTVAHDPNGDPLTFALPHLKSARGATLGLNGTIVTYDAAGAGFSGHDSFVYVAADHHGAGKRSFGVITVIVSAPQ